jgi:hypothetical protein
MGSALRVVCRVSWPNRGVKVHPFARRRFDQRVCRGRCDGPWRMSQASEQCRSWSASALVARHTRSRYHPSASQVDVGLTVVHAGNAASSAEVSSLAAPSPPTPEPNEPGSRPSSRRVWDNVAYRNTFSK